MTNPLQHQASLNQLVTFFESIEAGNTARLSQVYTDDVFFKDPFNEVRGIAAVVERCAAFTERGIARARPLPCSPPLEPRH